MEPELIAKVNSWKNSMTEETAKKLFIRNQALSAYKGNSVADNSRAVIAEILDSISVSSMSKESIAIHIGQLEKARALLAALTQGYEIAYAEEKEPEFKANHEKREKEKREAKKSDSTGLGISKEDLLKALSDLRSKNSNSNPAPVIANPTPQTPTPTIAIDKTVCDSCGKSYLTKLKSFHKCG